MPILGSPSDGPCSWACEARYRYEKINYANKDASVAIIATIPHHPVETWSALPTGKVCTLSVSSLILTSCVMDRLRLALNEQALGPQPHQNRQAAGHHHRSCGHPGMEQDCDKQQRDDDREQERGVGVSWHLQLAARQIRCPSRAVRRRTPKGDRTSRKDVATTSAGWH